MYINNKKAKKYLIIFINHVFLIQFRQYLKKYVFSIVFLQSVKKYVLNPTTHKTEGGRETCTFGKRVWLQTMVLEPTTRIRRHASSTHIPATDARRGGNPPKMMVPPWLSLWPYIYGYIYMDIYGYPNVYIW